MKYGFQSPEAEKYPPIIILDVTNVCNLECIHCPHRKIKKRLDYKPTFLKWNLYTKIIDEVSKNKILLFRYASDGESLLHPRFLDMVAYAKEHGIKPLNLTTNGLLLDEKTAKALLKLGIDIIDVSLDAFTKKRYDKIRKKSDFHKVMANLHNLLYLRKKINPTTKVMVSIINYPRVRDEIKDFKRYWEPLVDRVLVRNFCNVGGLVAKPNLRLKTKRWPCPQFWKRITITCKGKYRFCVEDWLNKTVVGDVRKKSIKEVWQGKEYQKLRRLHLEGKYSTIPICRNCTDWAASPWDYGYEYAVKKIMQQKRKVK